MAVMDKVGPSSHKWIYVAQSKCTDNYQVTTTHHSSSRISSKTQAFEWAYSGLVQMHRRLIDSCHALFLGKGNSLRFESAELEVKRHCEEYLGVGLGHEEKG